MSEIEITNREIEFIGHELSVHDIASMVKNVDDNIAEYLFERYYIDENSYAAKLKEINRKYNVKVFIVNSETASDIEALDYIEKELENWNVASGGNAVMPYYININLFEDPSLTDEAAGLLKPIEKSIYMKESKMVKDTFRHEMTHLNDLNFYDSVNIRLEASVWRSEFVKAGIAEENIDYAYENKLEFVAVASEGDFRKYTNEFKEYLVLLGMPEWVFDLPCEK